MAVDVDKLEFYSGYPIDKIVLEGSFSHTVPVGTPAPFPPYPTEMVTKPNEYGQKSFITASWSIDGDNYNSSLSQLAYSSGTFFLELPMASVNCGCSNDTLYFFLTNNYTADLTFDVNYAVYSIT